MTLAALAAAIAVAAAVQAVSGFGFAVVAAPVLVALTDPVTSVSLLAVLGILVNTVTLAAARGRPVVLRDEAVGLVTWALPGLAAGALLVTRLPDDVIRIAVGVLVLVVLARRLRAAEPARDPGRGESWRRPVTGVAAGTLTTTTGLNGLALVLGLSGRGLAPRAVRDTLAVIFVVLGLVGGVVLAAAGELRVPGDVGVLVAATVAGGVAGDRVHHRMSDAARERAIVAVLVVAALVAIGSALR